MVQDEQLPLTKVPREGYSAVEFNNFVDQFTYEAVQSEVYVLDKVTGHRETEGGIEYRCKWKARLTLAFAQQAYRDRYYSLSAAVAYCVSCNQGTQHKL